MWRDLLQGMDEKKGATTQHRIQLVPANAFLDTTPRDTIQVVLAFTYTDSRSITFGVDKRVIRLQGRSAFSSECLYAIRRVEICPRTTALNPIHCQVHIISISHPDSSERTESFPIDILLRTDPQRVCFPNAVKIKLQQLHMSLFRSSFTTCSQLCLSCLLNLRQVLSGGNCICMMLFLRGSSTQISNLAIFSPRTACQPFQILLVLQRVTFLTYPHQYCTFEVCALADSRITFLFPTPV